MASKSITYRLLKWNAIIKNHRIKFLGLWLLHTFNKRYLAVNFDPVLACNLRCKMCYFSDKEYVKKLKGNFKKEDLKIWAKRILPRTLKLQVGCGTEPTVYKHLDNVFAFGKAYKVPHISLTTNANLLQKEKLESWVKNGLNEITVSLHGVYKKTYEDLMDRGNYAVFLHSLKLITELKKKHPNLKLRINYTFNDDNFNELIDFYKVFGNYSIDFLQLRPISKVGNTAYSNFDLSNIIPKYDVFIVKFRKLSKEHKVTLLAPKSKENLLQRANTSSLIVKYTYCYISPNTFWKDGFDWKNETYSQFTKRIGWGKELFKNALTSEKKLKHLLKEQNLNYDVDYL